MSHITKSLPDWASTVFDDAKGGSPAAKADDDYALGGKTDTAKGEKRKMSNQMSALMKTPGVVKTVIGNSSNETRDPPKAGAMKDAPSWLMPKPSEHASKSLDVGKVPPVLARQLANWHRMTGSEKTKLEREFKVRGLSQPHLYLSDGTLYGNYDILIEKRGMVWNYIVESEGDMLFTGTAATEKNAIATVNRRLSVIDESVKRSTEISESAVEYLKSFAKKHK